MMTTLHLDFWTSPRGDISRIYFNDDAGNSVGHIEQRAAGFRDDTWSSTVPAAVLAAAVAATGNAALATADAATIFIALKGCSRGVNWSATKAKKAALKKLADSFKFMAEGTL